MDPMVALRDDLQVHAAAAALTQVAGPSGELYAGAIPRLPPIMQVERHQVTTTATQAASANRRRNEAVFRCPVPGCGSTFTRRFNLKGVCPVLSIVSLAAHAFFFSTGHLRSHTSERPYACEWPGCDKAFARQHDCKRHYQLHSAKAGAHVCQGCGKSFSRTDALNRHCESKIIVFLLFSVADRAWLLLHTVRSEGGVDCRAIHQKSVNNRGYMSGSPQARSLSPSETTDGTASEKPARSRPPSV